MFSKKPITMKVITLTEEFTALSVGYLVGLFVSMTTYCKTTE